MDRPLAARVGSPGGAHARLDTSTNHATGWQGER
jgi:hypothetical protein